MDYFNKMDGAGYVRASLLGMSQGISPIHDPLRLHPALHGVAQVGVWATQVSEASKEAGTLMRPLTDYGPLPFMGFAPHFLHHTLDHRLPIPSAFHPLGHKPVSGAGLAAPTPCSSASIHSSAFSPLPVKSAKVEVETSISVPASSSNIFSQSMLSIDTRNALFGGLSPPGMNSNVGMGEDRRDSPSPRGSHGSRDSPGHARDADTPNSMGEDGRALLCIPSRLQQPQT
ncbi:hypothetical protein FHG87_010841 [Trinorchestia longiramus]|nr:hypothetical protein FHG87_010841 [Trinorchestia longiramus]